MYFDLRQKKKSKVPFKPVLYIICSKHFVIEMNILCELNKYLGHNLELHMELTFSFSSLQSTFNPDSCQKFRTHRQLSFTLASHLGGILFSILRFIFFLPTPVKNNFAGLLRDQNCTSCLLAKGKAVLMKKYKLLNSLQHRETQSRQGRLGRANLQLKNNLLDRCSFGSSLDVNYSKRMFLKMFIDCFCYSCNYVALA